MCSPMQCARCSLCRPYCSPAEAEPPALARAVHHHSVTCKVSDASIGLSTNWETHQWAAEAEAANSSLNLRTPRGAGVGV